MEKKLLSIIIPCFNVDRYLAKCVDSVLNQTYSNLEIILIDDGSTDNTATLCDEFALRNARIKVIHQKNNGSAFARKIGLEKITGEYVTFMDADDIILPQMYTNLMNAMIKEEADIVQCGVFEIYEDNTSRHRFQSIYNNSYQIFSHIDGFFKLIEEKEWRSYMVNKIYKKNLFHDVTFPKGRGLDDDTTVMHILFHNAKKSLYFKDEYYGYLHRFCSITKTKNHQLIMKNVFDRCNARIERYQFVASHKEYSDIMPYLKSITISMCIAGLRNVAKYPSFFPYGYYYELSNNILSIPFCREEMFDEYISKMKRLEIFYLRFSPLLYRYTIPLIYKLLKH